MNSPYEDQDIETSDLFRQIREMRSPLSMNAVKSYIIEHVEEMTLWQKIQRLVLQTGAFTVIIGLICCINSPAGETKGVEMKEMTHDIQPSIQDVRLDKQIATMTPALNTLKAAKDEFLSTTPRVIDDSDETHISSVVSTEVRNISITPDLKDEATADIVNPAPTELAALLFPKENQTSQLHPFAEIQGIAYSGRIRMLGEGFSAGVTRDWQIASIRLMNTNGIRDERKDVPSLTNIGIKKETEQQISFMVGGIIEKGRLYGSLQIGPSYNMSQLTSGIKDVPASNTVMSQRFFGVSSEISFGYRITDFLSANIEGLVNYHSAISGGVMMSIMIRH